MYELGTTTPWNGTDQGWLTRDLKQFEFRLPKEIPAGQYLMRIEQISIHPPYRQKEFYMQVRLEVGRRPSPSPRQLTYLVTYLQCAHLNIASSYTGRTPGPTIRFPGGSGYNVNDPSMQLDSWAKPPPNYFPMPGPKVWPN